MSRPWGWLSLEVGGQLKRTTLNLIIDLTAAILLMAMIATGYLLRFPLPPGTNKSHVLWGISRHGWGDVHFWVSVGLLMILGTHIVLHWKWLVAVLAKRFARPNPSQKLTLVVSLVILAVMLTGGLLFVSVAYRNIQCIGNDGTVGACPGSTKTALHSSPALTGVLEILDRNCLPCHGPRRAAGNFRVDRKQDFFSVRDKGPLVIPGKSEISPLVQIVSGLRKNMPLPDRHRLPPHQVTQLKEWIDGGAIWPELEEKRAP